MAFKLVIDAGHGGNDPGAVNNALGFEEAAFTLVVGQALSKIAKGAGWDVKNTRQTRTDTPVPGNKSADLSKRATIANSFGADVFVSIHFNASQSKSARGFEIFVQQGSDSKTKALARRIGLEIKRRFPNMTYRHGVASELFKEANFAVLRGSNMPAVLIECGFIDNNADATFFNNDHNKELFATALFDGIGAWNKNGNA